MTKPSSHVRLFKPQFAGLVARGEKLQTVRPTPQRMPAVGDSISLRTWRGLPYRSKQRVLRSATITRVAKIWLGWNGILVDGRHADPESFARADGFPDFITMHKWFLDTHGIPTDGWRGILICWNAEVGSPPND